MAFLDLRFKSSEGARANSLAMSKVNGILDLNGEGWSQQRIAQVLCVNRKTVTDHVAGEASKRATAPLGSEPGPEGCERGEDSVPSVIAAACLGHPAVDAATAVIEDAVHGHSTAEAELFGERADFRCMVPTCHSLSRDSFTPS